MATISTTTELDVLAKYESLVKSSLGSESIYIRAKGTILELLNKGGLTKADQSKVISEVIGGLSGSLASSCMATALQWESTEKELALKKLELEKQLDILANRITQSANEATSIKNADYIQQAESLRQHGAMTIVDGKVTALNDTGLMYENIELTKKKSTSEVKAQNLSDAKLMESHAGINKLVADTYVNYGMFNGYTINANGLSGMTDITPTDLVTLSAAQLEIAKEQAKGYAWNAWSNAATGLGSTIGVALTSETDIFTGDNEGILTQWKDVITKLNAITQPTF